MMAGLKRKWNKLIRGIYAEMWISKHTKQHTDYKELRWKKPKYHLDIKYIPVHIYILRNLF